MVFDVDGERYTVGSIANGKAPDWAVENDPMEHSLPPLSEADIAMADELASEEVFLEMPDLPTAIVGAESTAKSGSHRNAAQGLRWEHHHRSPS